MSAATGEGTERLFECFREAAVEFQQDYLPELLRYTLCIRSTFGFIPAVQYNPDTICATFMMYLSQTTEGAGRS